jgi:hypothetical protein
VAKLRDSQISLALIRRLGQSFWVINKNYIIEMLSSQPVSFCHPEALSRVRPYAATPPDEAAA